MPGLIDFVTALGIAFVLEGMAYALFPGRARSAFEMISKMPDDVLRYLGLVAAMVGLFVVWLARS